MSAVAERLLAEACLVCRTPLAGPLSLPFRLAGVGRSSRNPNLCTRCGAHVQEGRLVELTVLFADLTGFTALTAELGPEEAHRVADEFLRMATECLTAHGAFIDKYLGDGVMAFFNAPIGRPDHAAQAVAAAMEIREGLTPLAARLGRTLAVGIGIAAGWARVGRLGSRDAKDYTAVGETVNRAARLEEQAGPGEIVLDRQVYEAVAAELPGLGGETLSLKGFREPVPAYRVGGDAQIAPRPAAAESADRPERAAAFGVGAMVFALLGAPCAIFGLVGSAAVTVGIGGLFSSASAFWLLDRPAVQAPLFALALAAVAANLYTLRQAGRLRRQALAEGRALPGEARDRRRTAFVMVLATLTLLAGALEVYYHLHFHG